MADLSGFSSSSFSTDAWINNAMGERPVEDSLESYLAQLAMKLHIVSQDYTDQLETGTNYCNNSILHTTVFFIKWMGYFLRNG